MRIIAGSAGGLRLQTPKTSIRPTADRVREALFSMLGDVVIDARVLDLFAGSGSLGIEALSRGAKRATFVEQSRESCQVIRGNLEKASLDGAARVISQDVARYLRGTSDQFDLIFADPPYAKKPTDDHLGFQLLEDEQLPDRITESGILILEVAHPSPVLETTRWQATDYRNYGATGIWFLQKA